MHKVYEAALKEKNEAKLVSDNEICALNSQIERLACTCLPIHPSFESHSGTNFYSAMIVMSFLNSRK